MTAIIAIHCTLPFTKGAANSSLALALATPFKFGTIGFFLISGFLLGERLDTCSPRQYFSRRANKIFFSWLLWFGIFTAINLVMLLTRGNSGHITPLLFLKNVYWSVSYSLIDSPYWFVPNLLIALATILAFRRYLYSLRLGFCLLAVNLIYVFNIYRLWFPSRHSLAVFGYVFYLWLGSYAANNFERTRQLLARFSMPACIALALITCILSFCESTWLTHLHNPEPLNTLRLSNQLFSLAMSLALFKLGHATWPRFVDVRRHTFGLYLSHSVALLFLVGLVRADHTIGKISSIPGVGDVLSSLTLFIATYSLCLAITAWIARRASLGWMIGLSSRRPAPRVLVDELAVPAPS